MKNLKIRRDVIACLLAGGLAFSLCACDAVVYDDNIEANYSVLDSQGEDVRIVPQVLEVPGEDFKLVVEYYLDEDASKKWCITDNKKIFTKIYTQGLDSDTKVYIDDIHTDTTLVSTKETMNGILQDTMDDGPHNGLILGYPISDSVSFYGVNQIDGQNDTFIHGSFLGFSGYQSGTIEEERYTEEDYLKAGVYANEISSVYGLLIQKGDQEPYGVDVSSDIVVLAYNKIITNYESGKQDIKTYNRDGSYTTTTVEPEKVKTK